jgi:hypothetical protein
VIPEHILQRAKAYATLVSGIIVAVLAIGVDEPLARWLAIAAAVAGALVTYQVPNAETTEQREKREAVEQAAEELLPEDPYPEGYDAAIEADADPLKK